MVTKLSATILFLLFAVSGVFAQEGSITGTVTDATTNEPLPGVNVVLPELEQGVATDVDGRYSLVQVPSGTHTLRASFVGYVHHETAIEVEDGEVVYDIAMEQDVLGLQDVVVTALGIEREQRSLGYASQRTTHRN